MPDPKNMNEDPKMTDILEIKVTLVGSRNECFSRDARKRMPGLGHATERACTELRETIARRLGTGAGRRFSLIVASKLLNSDEKIQLLEDHKAAAKKGK